MHADAGAFQTISVLNDEGTDNNAINLTSSAGGIHIKAETDGKFVQITGDAQLIDRLFVIGDVSLNANLQVADDKHVFIGPLTLGKGGGFVDTNTAFGVGALTVNSTGALNTSIGFNTLSSNDTGSSNIAIGASALASIHPVRKSVVGVSAALLLVIQQPIMLL